MSTIQPISLQELVSKCKEFTISDKIINHINKELLYNVENYSYIGAKIQWNDIFDKHPDYDAKGEIKFRLQEYYKDLFVTYDNHYINFSKK